MAPPAGPVEFEDSAMPEDSDSVPAESPGPGPAANSGCILSAGSPPGQDPSGNTSGTANDRRLIAAARLTVQTDPRADVTLSPGTRPANIGALGKLKIRPYRGAMPRYAFRVEYFGAPFSGWQAQPNQPTIQKTIEAAVRELDPDCPGISAAGRTDSGVHATGQVAHCDLVREWDPVRLSDAINHHLRPHPVAITAAARVADSFHARFSAIERQYVYRIVQRRAPLALDRRRAWRIGHGLDVDAMRQACAFLVGRHDFTTFRSSLCQAQSPIRTLDALDIVAHPTAGGTGYRIHARARSFLHRQVRSIVGTLERVGAGAWPPEQVGEALDARERSACGPVAPANGLCLARVRYQPEIFDG